ncbi:MAG: cell division protein FtsZ [Oscillospiraceae bacterium]|nr:cell division protein FtsZ [Oscillospiraceae bacterium]
MAIIVDNDTNGFEEIIKVVGVGGGGGNAVNRMIEKGIQGVQYVAVNTDAKALNLSAADAKVQIGVKLTGGKGAGAKREVGKQSAEENRDEIKAALAGSDMVFITAGMGGGTGTGAAPVVAEIAKEMGILTVAVVTKPFEFEQKKKMQTALAGIDELKGHVDSLIVIPNQRLLDLQDETLTWPQAMDMANDILNVGVKSIAELITVAGEINVDFADVRTIMEDAGYAHMAVGHGEGKEKAGDVAQQIIASPLLETSISSATKLLINVVSSADVPLMEINNAIDMITEAADPDVDVIFGKSTDPDMRDEMTITVIAAAFRNEFAPAQPAVTAAPVVSSSVEMVPAAPVSKPTYITEDYSVFFNMLNNL